MMKFKILLIAFFASIAFVACDDTQDPVADFSDTRPVYVELSSRAVMEVKEDTIINVPVRLREGQQKDVVVAYDITGAIAKSSTVTIARNTLSSNIKVTVPLNVVPAGSTTADAVVVLKTAMLGDTPITVGFLPTANERRIIRISKR